MRTSQPHGESDQKSRSTDANSQLPKAQLKPFFLFLDPVSAQRGTHFTGLGASALCLSAMGSGQSTQPRPPVGSGTAPGEQGLTRVRLPQSDSSNSSALSWLKMEASVFLPFS